MSAETPVGRRQFLRLATWAIGALIGAGLGIPALAYLIGPAVRREQSEEWIPLTSVSRVELGTPTLLRTTVQRQTGWIVDEEELSVFVLTEDGREFAAMSNICTHLGCRVRWIAESEQFFCPCHNGVFDKNGAVISGPPPRPLDRYETRVEGDQLFIRGG